MSGLPLKSDGSVPLQTVNYGSGPANPPSPYRMLMTHSSEGYFGHGPGFFTWSASFSSQGSPQATYAITFPALSWTPDHAYVTINSGSSGPVVCVNVYSVTTTTVAFKARTVDASNLPAFTAHCLVTSLN